MSSLLGDLSWDTPPAVLLCYMVDASFDSILPKRVRPWLEIRRLALTPVTFLEWMQADTGMTILVLLGETWYLVHEPDWPIYPIAQS